MASEIFCRARRADRPEEIEYLTSAAAAASAAVTSSGTASLGAAPLVGLSYDVGAGSGFSVSLTTEFLTIDFAVMVGFGWAGWPGQHIPVARDWCLQFQVFCLELA